VKTEAPPSVQQAAVDTLLNRAWGRPEQAVALTVSTGPLAQASETERLEVHRRRLAELLAEVRADATAIPSSATHEALPAPVPDGTGAQKDQ
jgi:hypothetical protein